MQFTVCYGDLMLHIAAVHFCVSSVHNDVKSSPQLILQGGPKETKGCKSLITFLFINFFFSFRLYNIQNGNFFILSMKNDVS